MGKTEKVAGKKAVKPRKRKAAVVVQTAEDSLRESVQSEAPKAPKPVVQEVLPDAREVRLARYRAELEHIRDNVVSGNPNHVDRINRVLGS